MKDIDKFSGKASSMSSVKKAYSIFNSIHLIQKSHPSSVKTLMWSSFIELIYILVFCIVVFLFTVQYLTNYYEPLEIALESFSRMTTDWSTMTMAATQLEFYKKGYVNITQDSLENDIIFEIFTRGLKNTKDYLNTERNLITRFNYQTIFKNTIAKNTETTFYETSEINFIDVMDQVIALLIDLLNQNLENQNVRNLEFLPLNFGYVIDIYNNILDSITNEFLNSNGSTSEGVLTVMLVFVIIIIPLKLLQLNQINQFHQTLIKLLNIFLRVNQASAYNEFLFQKEVMESVFNPDKNNYLYIYFPEKIINKKYFELPLGTKDEDKINKKNSRINKSGNDKAKKFSFHNLRPLSTFRIKFVLFLSFIVIFCFFFFIYLNWTVVNIKITDLISIHNFFYNFYTMPSHVLALNLLMMREKIIGISELEAGNEPTQKTAFKQSYFISELEEHLVEMENLGNQYPNYLFEVADNINDDVLNRLIKNNVCSELYLEGLIYETENIRCNIIINSAFQKGIISVLNQMLNTVKMQGELVNTNPGFNLELQKELIYSFLSSSENLNNLISEHFYEEGNLKVFKYLTEYYTSLISKEIDNMKLMIELFTVGVGCLVLFISWYLRSKFISLYSEMSYSLSLIPYERLLNDEQTVFLIKKYMKN